MHVRNASPLFRFSYSLVVALGICQTAAAAVDVRDLGLKGDGETNDTAALRAALTGGGRELYFPAGTYRLGSLEVPSDTTLRFSPRARVAIEPTEIQILADVLPKTELRPWLTLVGDGIVIEGLNTSGLFEAVLMRGKKTIPAVNTLVFAQGVADLRFAGLRAVYSVDYGRGNKAAPTVIRLHGCHDVALADSHFENIMHGIEAVGCRNVDVRGNRAMRCNTITTFRHSEGLRHHDNWSRQVVYQCVFRGGSPDPSRKAPAVPLGSSATVQRGLQPDAADFNQHLLGTYDVQIANNYAEYGRTLAWGNKGRQVCFLGNVSRFMTDYSYGVEGCENVLFANNISINARSVGIMSMYWGDKLVLSGNQVIVRDEPYVQEYSAFAEQSAYWGGLVRFHHGPTTAEDAAAGSRYGAGHAIVTGNLLINEFHDQVRSVKVEGGRDILVSGNKIINGWVAHVGSSGAVTVSGNEMISTMPVAHTMVSLVGEHAVIKDNVMRHVGGAAEAIAVRDVVVSTKDEAEAARPEEQQQSPLPAVVVRTGAKMSLLVVEGNVIEGRREQALLVETVTRESEPAKLVIRDNSLTGAMNVVGPEDSYRLLSDDNIDLETLSACKPITASP